MKKYTKEETKDIIQILESLSRWVDYMIRQDTFTYLCNYISYVEYNTIYNDDTKMYTVLLKEKKKLANNRYYDSAAFKELLIMPCETFLLELTKSKYWNSRAIFHNNAWWHYDEPSEKIPALKEKQKYIKALIKHYKENVSD